MAKINPENYRQASDTVNAEDIDDAAIVRITEFNDGERKDKEGMWALVKFEETGDKIMWLTDAAIETLVEKFGDDSDDWIGKQIPIEKYDTKNGPRVRIMASEEWDNAFKQAGVKQSPSRKSTPVARAGAKK